MEKFTKVQKFAEVIKAVEGGNSAMTVAEMVEFLNREVELLNGKANRKASKKASANGDYKIAVTDCLARLSDPATVTTILAESGLAISNQKMTAVLKEMIADGTVINTKDKKGSYYALAPQVFDEDTDEE